MDLGYSNAAVRPPGPLLRLLTLVPAIGRVQRQVAPYAEAWEAANARALAGPPAPLWVALGDSLTQGVGASAYDRGWVGQLSTRLRPELPHRLVNLSVYGARIDDVLDRQVPVLDRLTQADRVAVVTCVVGSNDLISRRRDLAEAYRRLLDRLPVGVVVANLPNPTAAARAHDVLVREAAAAGRLRLADMRRDGPQGWRGLLASDRFHPNDAGYARMADVFEPAVRSALADPVRS